MKPTLPTIRPHPLAALAAAFVVGSIVPSAAQTPAPADEPVQLPEFTVVEDARGYRATNSISGTRTNTLLENLPLTINVVTEEMIRDIGATTLTEALRFTAGVNENPQAATGEEVFQIRGQNARFVYRDGVRRWRGHDAFFISRVEVIKGPSAILYGESLPGGAINYISKEPRYEAGYLAAAGIDSHGRARLELDATGPLVDGKVAYRLLGALDQGETFYDYEEVKNRAFSGSLLFTPWERTRLIVQAEHLDRRTDNAALNGGVAWRGEDNVGAIGRRGQGGRPIGIHPLNPPETNPFGFPGNNQFIDVETLTLGLRLEQRFADWATFRSNLNYTEADMLNNNILNNDVNRTGLPLLDPTTRQQLTGVNGDVITYNGVEYTVGGAPFRPGSTSPLVTSSNGNLRVSGNSLLAPTFFNPNIVGPRRFGAGQLNNHDLSWQNDLVLTYKLGATAHQTLLGYEYQRLSFFNFPTGPAPAEAFGIGYDLERRIAVDIFGNPWTGDVPAQPVLYDQPKRGDISKIHSVYAAHQVRLFDDRVRLLGGLRYGERTTHPRSGAASVKVDSGVVPQAGVIVKLTPNVSAYASVSESFLFQSGRYPDFQGGGLLPPESGRGYDLGFKFSMAEGRLSGNVTYFHIEREIARTDPAIVDPVTGRFGVSTGSTERSEGFEGELFYNVSTAFQVMANFSYTDSIIARNTASPIEDGQRLENVPQWQAGVFGKYRFSGGLDGFEVGGGVAYKGEVPLNDWPFYLGSYTLVDLFAAYRHKLGDGDTAISYRVAVSNLFDKVYFTPRTFGGQGRTFSARVTFEF